MCTGRKAKWKARSCRVFPEESGGFARYDGTGSGVRSRRMRALAIVPVLALVLLLATGCGSSSPRPAARVPDVTMKSLDAAEDELDAAGLEYDAKGGGLFGIVVRSHWTVCRQEPAAGLKARHVTLYVARHCGYGWDWEEE
jgi:hypothetical protein